MLRTTTSLRHLPITARGAVAERQVIQRIYLALTASDPRTVGAAGGLAEPGWRSDMADHTCAQCGDVFDRLPGATGQGASWCTPCRRRYMRDYQRAHYKPRPPRPAKPPKPQRTCKICSAPCPGRSRTLCGSRECELENYRLHSRSRRQDRPPKFLATRERGWRTRRARKQAVESERYTAVEIAERDGWRCHLCGKKISDKHVAPHNLSLTIDHVIPLADGGADTRANVKATHRLCNSVKGRRALPQGEQLMLVG